MLEIIVSGQTSRQKALEAVQGINSPHVVTIKPFKKKRTRSQNSLMWARYEEIAHAIHSETGADKDDIHEYCKAHFAPPKVKEVFGEAIVIRSTAALDTKEMSEFMDKVEAWAATEFGVQLGDAA